MQETVTSGFGMLLVDLVRDEVIEAGHATLSPDATSVLALRWRQLGGYGPQMGPIIADIVDVTIATLLRSLDEGRLKLRWKTESGEYVELTRESLLRQYLAPDGWRATYSKQSFSQDDDALDELDPPGTTSATSPTRTPAGEAPSSKADRA
jgi:hypothetical protein